MSGKVLSAKGDAGQARVALVLSPRGAASETSRSRQGGRVFGHRIPSSLELCQRPDAPNDTTQRLGRGRVGWTGPRDRDLPSWGGGDGVRSHPMKLAPELMPVLCGPKSEIR